MRHIIAVNNLQRGIPTKCESAARAEYVPALGTHRPTFSSKVFEVIQVCVAEASIRTLIARGEILGFVTDETLRKHCQGCFH